MPSRRDVLVLSARAGAALALLPAGCALPERERALWVNDVHSRLNRTRVKRVERPASTEEVQAVVRRARGEGLAISVAAARHAMGGQQFGSDTALIDATALTRVHEFDPDAGEIEVGAGTDWPSLLDALARLQDNADTRWTIRQKQTGADRLSLGGALAANIHGRGLRSRPFVDDVAAFTLVNANGDALRCSREENSDLFRLAIGGYGLFGVVTSIRLRLARRRKLERVAEVIWVEGLENRFQSRIDDGFLYGDYQFATDPATDVLLRGVFSCYRPLEDDAEMPSGKETLDEREWLGLIVLGHEDRAEAFARYASHYMATSGQRYWSDDQQRSLYIDDYHAKLRESLGGGRAEGSEMITEIYVPRPLLEIFMRTVREDMIKNDMNLVYGTVRLIEQEDETVLAWARRPWACIIFNLHVNHDEAGLRKAQDDFRLLIDRAIEHQGSYYLTYHRWATRDQVIACHPRLPEFLSLKKAHDPDEVFQSEWYRHYRDMLA